MCNQSNHLKYKFICTKMFHRKYFPPPLCGQTNSRVFRKKHKIMYENKKRENWKKTKERRRNKEDIHLESCIYRWVKCENKHIKMSLIQPFLRIVCAFSTRKVDRAMLSRNRLCSLWVEHGEDTVKCIYKYIYLCVYAYIYISQLVREGNSLDN